MDDAGHGSFGIIRKVQRKSDGYILCRKEISYCKMSQKEREQLQAELARLQTDLRLLVLVDHEVFAGLTGATGLAECDRRAGDVLQLDRHMLEHMAEPGALPHAPLQATRLPKRAAMRVQAISRSEKPSSLLVGQCSSAPRSSWTRIIGVWL